MQIHHLDLDDHDNYRKPNSEIDDPDTAVENSFPSTLDASQHDHPDPLKNSLEAVVMAVDTVADNPDCAFDAVAVVVVDIAVVAVNQVDYQHHLHLHSEDLNSMVFVDPVAHVEANEPAYSHE
jgi:hypothetical protein